MKNVLSFARRWSPILLTLVIVLLPLVTLAQGPQVGGGTGPQFGGGTGPQVGGGAGQSSGCTGSSCILDNPLKVTNFCDLLKIILQALILLGLPVAVIFLVWVGFKFILAQGKPEAITEAQKNLYYTVIGIAIFLGAWTIATVIARTMEALGVPGLSACVN